MIGAAPVRRSGILAIIGRVLMAFVVLAVALAVVGTVFAYSSYASLASSLKPRLAALSTRDTFETSRIYDRNGTLLYEFLGAGKRTHVSLPEISPLLINATIAIEDKTFYKNAGFDVRGILYAFYKNMTSGEIAGGGSSITQQLVKRAVLTDVERNEENQYWRKVKEVILAQELTKQYSKDEIMELYLNEIYYGNLSYGIEAASESYFGVHAKDLSLAQASLLAGLGQLPSAYDPVTNGFLENGDTLPGVTLGANWYEDDYALPGGLTPPKRRQIAVLSQMVDEGYVTKEVGRAAIADDLRFTKQETPLNAPHFVFWVRKLLEEKYGQQFANEGLSIYTSLDLNMQHMVQEKAKDRIQELAERNIHNAAVVVMQPNTGQVLAMVGSIDYNATKASTTRGQTGNVLDGQVNVATRERQPGSALKPFTYLSAMEKGATPATVWWDVPTEFLGGLDAYAPENYNGRWNGPLRTRTALANSLNMPAVKALKFAGLDHTLDLLHRAGITGLQRGEGFYGLSLTLGGGEVTPLDLTTAYNTLASQGHYYPPVAVLKVVNSRGEVLEQFTPTAAQSVESFDPEKVATPPTAGEQVLNPDHVAIITDMLADNAARAPVFTTQSKLRLSRPAAVKTGTTNDWRDAWAVGFTPYVTVGVWTGNNNNEPTAKVESVTSGGAIWHDVMEAIFADARFQQELAAPYGGKLPTSFTLPSDIVRKQICKLPGPFNYYGEELFSPDMLKKRTSAAATATAGDGMFFGTPATTATSSPEDDILADQFGCNSFAKMTVAKLGQTTTQVVNDAGETEEKSSANYCRVVDGVNVPGDMITTITVWKTPKPSKDEKVQYVWQGGSAGGAVGAGSIPDCTSDMIYSVAPPGSVRMPDLRGFGENQAKEKLAALGFNTGMIFVQYQDRSQIPDDYDKFPAYAVVSSMPAANTWVQPDEFIILGVRAPDDAAPAGPTETPVGAGPPGSVTSTPLPADGGQPAPTPAPADGGQPTPAPVEGGQPAPTPAPADGGALPQLPVEGGPQPPADGGAPQPEVPGPPQP
ncbi:glycosyl transferase [Chloroflexia bacterium SDU3-3]|nr:glycosyl transferase [Chloroflexia bacterium SDU3-3]